ncbi:hypothetical protein [Kribbella sp. NPDC048928]|uniref:hypothetical protein n=1 Tax=Kribbella sp. NPDC048928 TaxID=3364111 RepID=UPI0037212C68
MDSDETLHVLPDGDRVWVIKTSTAAGLLPQMLDRFRLGHQDPLIFGDTGEPEGVVVPFELWRALDTRVFDEDGFDTTYTIARARLADPRPSIPIEQVAAELGIDLSQPVDDSDLPKS